MQSAIDHIDVSAVARRGVRLGYTPDVLTDAGSLLLIIALLDGLMIGMVHLPHAVADLAVLLALMAGRGGKETMLLVQNGQACLFSTMSTIYSCCSILSPSLTIYAEFVC